MFVCGSVLSRSHINSVCNKIRQYPPCDGACGGQGLQTEAREKPSTATLAECLPSYYFLNVFIRHKISRDDDGGL